jgi:transcriptional regulator with XRE-family HTH domain
MPGQMGDLTSPLSQLLNVIVRQYRGTRRDFAERAAVSRSQLSHWMTGSTAHGPGLHACLRMAHAGHCSPSRMLRAAGLANEAMLLESLYGAPAELETKTFVRNGMTAAEVEFAILIRRLDATDRRTLVHFAKRFDEARARLATPSGRGRMRHASR